MTEFKAIDRAECLELLATKDLGRFAVVVDGYALIFPVNYVLDGDIVTFRTAAGTKIDASLHSNVSFEVDHMDKENGVAWSVLVLGAVDRMGVTEEERERISQLGVSPIVPGDKPAWIRILPDQITGRRLL